MAMEQLLELVQGEAKLTPAQLAVMLGEREEDVVKAIQRYEKEGVIKGYHALINWERTDENSFILKITAAEKLHGKILLPEGFTFEDGTHEAELISGEFAIRKNT